MLEMLIVNQPVNNRGCEAAHKSLIRILNQEIPNAKIKVVFQDVNESSI